MNLVWPSLDYLPAYAEALRLGWSPDNRRPEAAHEELARIEAEPAIFIEDLVDREARGPAIKLPDGKTVARLPGYVRWMWDGSFCGAIGFRWQPGTTALPPYCLGHIGYSVVPWKQGRGYATAALARLLEDIRAERLDGMEFVELVTQVSNVASQRAIEKNGGEIFEAFRDHSVHGGAESLRFRIYL